MQTSYTKNYIKIYLWQGLSIVLNLASLFIVIPHLSKIPEIYGIYTICISVSLFLSYIDIGFMSAGFKYASESYIKGNKEEEVRITGFVSFIMLIFIILYVVVIGLFAINPQLLIKNLTDSKDVSIATKLLLIQVFASVFIIAQRCIQIIYGVRLQDFILQRINIVGSTVKILSVFYFFSETNYNIVGYYFFIQLVTLSTIFFSLLVAQRKLKYNLIFYLRSIRYSKEVFGKTRKLALGSFLITIAWLLYYELDSFVIAKLSGAKLVAYYAVGFTILTFYRSLFGTVFSPFNARFNHFIGLNDIEGLKVFYSHVMVITLPIVVLPVVTLYMLMPPFVSNWVGNDYNAAVPVARWLILSNLLGFISYPTGILIMAKRELKLLNLTSCVLPVVFWGGIAVTYQYWGIESFAFFKFIAFTSVASIYISVAIRFLSLNLRSFLSRFFTPAIVPFLFLVASLSIAVNYLPIGKSKVNMLITIATGAGASAISLYLYFVLSKPFRSYVLKLVGKQAIAIK